MFWFQQRKLRLNKGRMKLKDCQYTSPNLTLGSDSLIVDTTVVVPTTVLVMVVETSLVIVTVFGGTVVTG